MPCLRSSLLLLLVILSGCKSSASRLEIVLDEAQSGRLLRYYFGAYVGLEGGDPFAVDLLSEKAGRFYVFPEVLESEHPGWGMQLRQVASDSRLDWEELSSFLHETYYAARHMPPTLEKFCAIWPYHESSWLRFEVDGPMTMARRHVYIAEEALLSSLAGYMAQGQRLIYPAATAIVAEHHEDGEHLETTAMLKRSDGFWDFVTYGADGELASHTVARPRSLATPTQCVGCHFGSKQFEPERSFPAQPLSAPDGLRAYYVDEAMRDPSVVRFFDEHRKRSDTVLGIYNTLYVSQLRVDRREGNLSKGGQQILEQLGL